MKSHYDGPVFIHTFELETTPAHARVLAVRFDMAQQFYNAMLRESHKRLRRCRHDLRWHEAVLLLQQGDKGKAGKLFGEVKKAYGYSEFGLNDVASHWRQNSFRIHLDSQTCYDIAKRAFRACEAFRKDRTHRASARRRVQYRRRGTYHTISSNTIKVNTEAQQIRWWGLTLPYLLEEKDADGLQKAVLQCMQDPDNIRSYGKRITRRIIRGTPRFYVQLTLCGQPFQKAKHPVSPGVVGIDLGPSVVAIVSGHPQHELTGELHPLAEGCEKDEKAIRRLQRYLARSRRDMNPHCFDEQGRWIKGARVSVVSKRAKVVEQRLHEMERRLAERRKRAHNALVHTVLAKGIDIKAEELSYRAWQRGLFGKSIGRRSAGGFLARLKQQAETVGGTFTAIPTHSTKFSQLCHGCGTYEKKPLSLRVHQCVCGVGPIQRDIYSAFLAHQFPLGDTTLARGAVQAAFAVLQHGATGDQSALQATSKQACLTLPCVPSTGESGSGANVVLPDAEAPACTDHGGSGKKVSGTPQLSQPIGLQRVSDQQSAPERQEMRAPPVLQQRRRIAPRPVDIPRQERCREKRYSQAGQQLSFFQEDT